LPLIEKLIKSQKSKKKKMKTTGSKRAGSRRVVVPEERKETKKTKTAEKKGEKVETKKIIEKTDSISRPKEKADTISIWIDFLKLTPIDQDFVDWGKKVFGFKVEYARRKEIGIDLDKGELVVQVMGRKSNKYAVIRGKKEDIIGFVERIVDRMLGYPIHNFSVEEAEKLREAWEKAVVNYYNENIWRLAYQLCRKPEVISSLAEILHPRDKWLSEMDAVVVGDKVLFAVLDDLRIFMAYTYIPISEFKHIGFLRKLLKHEPHILGTYLQNEEELNKKMGTKMRHPITFNAKTFADYTKKAYEVVFANLDMDFHQQNLLGLAPNENGFIIMEYEEGAVFVPLRKQWRHPQIRVNNDFLKRFVDIANKYGDGKISFSSLEGFTDTSPLKIRLSIDNIDIYGYIAPMEIFKYKKTPEMLHIPHYYTFVPIPPDVENVDYIESQYYNALCFDDQIVIAKPTFRQTLIMKNPFSFKKPKGIGLNGGFAPAKDDMFPKVYFEGEIMFGEKTKTKGLARFQKKEENPSEAFLDIVHFRIDSRYDLYVPREKYRRIVGVEIDDDGRVFLDTVLKKIEVGNIPKEKLEKIKNRRIVIAKDKYLKEAIKKNKKIELIITRSGKLALGMIGKEKELEYYYI